MQVEYIGLGFGSTKTRSKLKQSVYIDAMRKRLKALEYCSDREAGR